MKSEAILPSRCSQDDEHDARSLIIVKPSITCVLWLIALIYVMRSMSPLFFFIVEQDIFGDKI